MILPGASSRVKLSFVMSFKRLSNHINLSDDYCSQVLSGCIDLIEDPDYDVRMKFRYPMSLFCKSIARKNDDNFLLHFYLIVSFMFFLVRYCLI